MPIPDFHSDIESPGSTNRQGDVQTSEGILRTGAAVETDADQAKDDERDNFTLHDEEDEDDEDEEQSQ